MRRPTGWIDDAVTVRWTSEPHHIAVEYAAFLAIIDAGLCSLKRQFEDEYPDGEPDPDTADVSEYRDFKETLRQAKVLMDYLTPESAPDKLPF
jgi:hypothetical protein